MIQDIRTFFWFIAQGSKFYSTLLQHILTKLKPNKDSPQDTETAKRWCQDNLTSIEHCFENIGITASDNSIEEAFSNEYELKIRNIMIMKYVYKRDLL